MRTVLVYQLCNMLAQFSHPYGHLVGISGSEPLGQCLGQQERQVTISPLFRHIQIRGLAAGINHSDTLGPNLSD
ncbi:MAG: hypothetical protein BIFFINMI_00925 [Phycisphaerae bacterium]|nr:hypothetical protein [Phycisphaerae bacterium]